MSKNVKMNRKRFIKLTAGEFGLQTRELTDAVMGMVPAARCADCKDLRNRPEEDRWKEEDQWP